MFNCIDNSSCLVPFSYQLPQTLHSHIGNLVLRLEAAYDFKKMGDIVSAPFQSPVTKSRGTNRSDRIGGWGSITLAVTRRRGISWK
jgi:hypothetical protein